MKGRKKWRTRFSTLVKEKESWFWFHASSAGEFEDGKEILIGLRKAYPGLKVLLTFYSPSGFEQNKKNNIADAVAYLPLDTKRNARDFVEFYSPKFVVFSRNDIWPNYLEHLRLLGIKTFLTGFACTSSSSFFKFPIRKLYKYVFSCFEQIGVQDDKTASLLNLNFGLENVSVYGNPRADTIYKRSQQFFQDELISNFSANHFCIVAGSILPKDLKFILETEKLLEAKSIRWILVQHEIDIQEFQANREKEPEKHLLWSENKLQTEKTKFLWIDTVGILAAIYKFGQLAWVGGGFNRIGIHNILEPAAHGCWVAFGPNHRNYTEALQMIELGFAKVFRTPQEFADFLGKESYSSNHQKIKKYFADLAGGSKGNVEMIISGLK